MGFVWILALKVERPSGRLMIASNQILRCRRLLADHGIVVPADYAAIPLRDESSVEKRSIRPNEGPPG